MRKPCSFLIFIFVVVCYNNGIMNDLTKEVINVATGSIVDYMNSTKQNSSFQNRAALASKYGVKGYKGTAQQNTQLLSLLQKNSSKASKSSKPSAPVKSAIKSTITPTKSTTHAPAVIGGADKAFYNSFSQAEQQGKADPSQLGRYKAIVDKYKLAPATTSSSSLHNLSLAALGGDTNAQNYIKTMGLQAQTAKNGLWSGVTNAQLDANHALRSQYWKDNPTSDYTKAHDMSDYNRYVGMINGNQGMNAHQMDVYNHDISKWNLQDVTNPYVQESNQLAKDKQSALNAQDTALNQGMAAIQANNFQQNQQLQQQFADRGVSGSGIAADQSMRANMAANQQYQQAYANAATQKSNIANTYDQEIGKNNEAKLTSDQAQATSIAQQQTQRDTFLTQQTGYVYLDGKVQKDSKGNPLKTTAYQKQLSDAAATKSKQDETNRHDKATEGLTAQKNANDYSLGAQKNGLTAQKNANDYQVSEDKIKADVTKSLAATKLNYAKLDYNYAKLNSDSKVAEDKIQVAIQNAKTSSQKGQLTSLNSKLKGLTSQITAYQKAGKKPPSKLVSDYNNTNGSIAKIVNSMSFNSSSGGGGGSASYKSDFSKAASLEAIPKSEQSAMSWIIQKESSGNSKAQNSKSTAHGYAQFLDSTAKEYDKKMGLNYNSSGVDQIREMYHYVMDKYGSPSNAKAFWEKHGWY